MPHDFAVFAGARLGLIGIDDEVMRPAIRNLRHKRPFETGRKARAATPTKAGSLHLVDDPITAFVDENLGAIPIAAHLCRLQVSAVKAVKIGEDTIFIRKHRSYPFAASAAAAFAASAALAASAAAMAFLASSASNRAFQEPTTDPS